MDAPVTSLDGWTELQTGVTLNACKHSVLIFPTVFDVFSKLKCLNVKQSSKIQSIIHPHTTYSHSTNNLYNCQYLMDYFSLLDRTLQFIYVAYRSKVHMVVRKALAFCAM